MRQNLTKHKHSFVLQFAPLQRTCLFNARACECGLVRKFKTKPMYPKKRWVDGCSWPVMWCAAHPDKHISEFHKRWNRIFIGPSVAEKENPDG